MTDQVGGLYNLDRLNSTATPLSADGVFTGSALVEVDEFASVSIMVYADEASATGGVSFEWSKDATNWDLKETYTLAKGQTRHFALPVRAEYFRVVYTNGSTDQTAFRLSTRYHASTAPVNVQVVKRTQYGAAEVSERTNIIELRSNLGVVSNIRNVKTLAGSATITAANGEILLTTTATASDAATLDSAERGRYMPGYTGQVGIGVRYAATPTGAMQVKWGAWDGTNGFYFGQDATGVFVAILNAGSETKVYQTAWNVDKMDGTGPSGQTLDLSRGAVFHFNFAWYGYGPIEFAVVIQDSDGKQQEFPVHWINDSGETVQEPNLPIRAHIENGATATGHVLYVGGRQYSIVGQYNPARRITSGQRLALASVSTTVKPIIGIRRKSGFSSTSVKIEGFDIITDQPLVVEMRTKPTGTTAASFATPTNHTAAETVVEADISATAITGGEVLWAGLVEAAGAGATRSGFSVRDVLPQDFINTDAVYLCARRAGGTDATVSAVFRVSEEW